MSDNDQKPHIWNESFTPKQRSHKGLASRTVNLFKLKKKLTTVLERDTNHLMRASLEGKLTEAEANDLRGYLKLIKDLVKQEEEASSGVSDEELRRRALEK